MRACRNFYYLTTASVIYPIRRTVSAPFARATIMRGIQQQALMFDTLASVLTGCDSVRTLYLTVRPSFQTTLSNHLPGRQLCGIYQFGNLCGCVYRFANGCDSTRTLHLTVNRTYRTTITTSICQGDNYAGYTSSGTYVDVFTAANGCGQHTHLCD